MFPPLLTVVDDISVENIMHANYYNSLNLIKYGVLDP